MESTPSQRQTQILAGLIAFGVLAIALGSMNLKRAIGPHRPAATPPVKLPTTIEEVEAQRRATLVGLDTDADGLPDLTELEQTRTSPYLADSDSDGKTDKEEVDAGTDPNCPVGKTCSAAPSAASSPRPTSPFGGFEFPGLTPPTPETSDAQPDVDVGVLRAALERQGVPRATLDQLSDEELRRSYGETLGVITKGTTGSESPFTPLLSEAFTRSLLTGKPDVEALIEKLPSDAPAVRKFLEQSGVSRDQLQRLDDKTLLQIWQQVLTD
ncbi:hypothetical protein HY635_04270, partial [Candidatus Uhrbacteria bacterium]|nr:hypothetical protein [Candidatus Uhrbacteria bacterium]